MTEEQFLHITHNSASNKRMMFAETLVPPRNALSVRCDVCGVGRLFPERYPEISLHSWTNLRLKAPDFLGCGSYPLFIVSEAVRKDWEGNGITGFEPFPFTVVSAKPSVADAQTDVLRFHHLKITGRCSVDLEKMGCTVVYLCPKCGYSEVEPAFNHPFVIAESSWDGSDLFVDPLFPCVVFCTRRVLELTKERRRTNARFTRPEEYWNVEERVFAS